MKNYIVVVDDILHDIKADFAEVVDGNRLFFMAMEKNRYEPVAAFDDGCWDYFITDPNSAGAE